MKYKMMQATGILAFLAAAATDVDSLAKMTAAMTMALAGLALAYYGLRGEEHEEKNIRRRDYTSHDCSRPVFLRR